MSWWRRDDTIEIALEKAERLIHDRGWVPRGHPHPTPIGIGIAPGQPTIFGGRVHAIEPTPAQPHTRMGGLGIRPSGRHRGACRAHPRALAP